MNKYKPTKWENFVEWFKAIFWLLLFFFLIAINHPKVQKLFSLILPRNFPVWGNDDVGDGF